MAMLVYWSVISHPSNRRIRRQRFAALGRPHHPCVLGWGESWRKRMWNGPGRKWALQPAIEVFFRWMFPKMVGFPPNHPIWIGFSIINHPFWGTPIVGNIQIVGAIDLNVSLSSRGMSLNLDLWCEDVEKKPSKDVWVCFTFSHLFWETTRRKVLTTYIAPKNDGPWKRIFLSTMETARLEEVSNALGFGIPKKQFQDWCVG